MTETLPRLDEPADAELISAVRGGDVSAYGGLFERHVGAARRLARQLVGPADADDLVSDAYMKVLRVLQNGGGPDVAFRAYLLTAIRRLHVDKIRAGSKLHSTDDMAPFDPGVPFRDTAVEGFENAAAAKAFASLPERWQLVLWHTEVEGQKPAEVAALLGMSANSVSALAYRAREGLRQAFLSSHAADIDDAQCAWTHEHLGAYIRDGVSKRDAGKVEKHLDECRKCMAIYLELTEVNSNLGAILAPLLLGAAGTAYLASAGGLAAKGGLMLLVDRVKDFVAGNSTAAAAGGVAAAAVVAGVTIAVVATGDDQQRTSSDPPAQVSPSRTAEPPADVPTTAPPPPPRSTPPPPAPAPAPPEAAPAPEPEPTGTVGTTIRDVAAIPTAPAPEGPPNREPSSTGGIPAQSSEFGGSVSVHVVEYFRDPDGDELFVTRVEQPAHGTATIGRPAEARTRVADDGYVTYSPDPLHTGPDRVTFFVSDGEHELEGSFQVTTQGPVPNQAPTADDDMAGTDAGASVTIDVLANDTDPDADELSIAAAADGSNGSVEVSGDGTTLTYTPAAGFSGTDTFDYTVTDGELTDTATVTVRVDAPDAPKFDLQAYLDVVGNGGVYEVTIAAEDLAPNGRAEAVLTWTNLDDPNVTQLPEGCTYAENRVRCSLVADGVGNVSLPTFKVVPQGQAELVPTFTVEVTATSFEEGGPRPNRDSEQELLRIGGVNVGHGLLDNLHP